MSKFIDAIHIIFIIYGWVAVASALPFIAWIIYNEIKYRKKPKK